MITKFKLFEDYDDDYDYDDEEKPYTGIDDYNIDFSELKKYFTNFTETEDEMYFNVYHHQDPQYNEYSVSITFATEIIIHTQREDTAIDHYYKELNEFNSKEIIEKTITAFSETFPNAFEIYLKEMKDKNIEMDEIMRILNINKFNI